MVPDIRVPVLEAVPNISEGRDLGLIREMVDRISEYDVEVLDWSTDPDHHRAVITFIGPPPAVEEAAVSLADFAREHIDLRKHRGVHPRIGALDVLPFVPLNDMSMVTAAGHGAAMANGHPDLKEAADFVCGHNQSDGIVDVVEYIRKHNEQQSR